MSVAAEDISASALVLEFFLPLLPVSKLYRNAVKFSFLVCDDDVSERSFFGVGSGKNALVGNFRKNLRFRLCILLGDGLVSGCSVVFPVLGAVVS